MMRYRAFLAVLLVLCAGCVSSRPVHLSDGGLIEFSGGHIYSVHVKGDGIGSFRVSIEEVLHGESIPVVDHLHTIHDPYSNPRGKVDGRLTIVMNTDTTTGKEYQPDFEIIYKDWNYMQEHWTTNASHRIRRFEGGNYTEDRLLPLEGRTVIASWLCNTNDWEDGWASHDAAIDLLNFWKPMNGPTRLDDTWASNHLARLVAFSATNDVVFVRVIMEITGIPNQELKATDKSAP